MWFLIRMFALVVLGGTSRPPQQIFQNEAAEEPLISTFRDVVFVAIAIFLFVVVISFRVRPSWFQRKKIPMFTDFVSNKKQRRTGKKSPGIELRPHGVGATQQQQKPCHDDGLHHQKQHTQHVVEGLQQQQKPRCDSEPQQQQQKPRCDIDPQQQQKEKLHHDSIPQQQQQKTEHVVQQFQQEQRPHSDQGLKQQQKQHGVEEPHHIQDLQQTPQKRRPFPPPPPNYRIPSYRLEQEEVIVMPAGEEDAMFGSNSLITPPYKLSRNVKRNIRLMQLADSKCFK